MAVSKSELLTALNNAFPDGDIELHDTVGDSNHYSLYIKSKQFSGKNKVQQHKLVYNALQSMFAGNLHAIQIKTEVKNEEAATAKN